MARRALLIGVSEYGEGFGPLPGCLLDVEAMAAALADPGRGAFELLESLKNPGVPEMTAGIEKFLGEAGRDDLLLLYFSGHGDLGNSVAQERLHLCGKGTFKQGKRLVESSAMSADFLKRQMDLCRSQRIVVILDCCYSGAIAGFVAQGGGGGCPGDVEGGGSGDFGFVECVGVVLSGGGWVVALYPLFAGGDGGGGAAEGKGGGLDCGAGSA